MNKFDQFKYNLLYDPYVAVDNKASSHDDPANHEYYFHRYCQVVTSKFCDIAKKRMDECILNWPDNKEEE